MPSLKSIVKPSFWALNLIIVFEILFMISPLALYFYSLYGPMLRVFNGFEGTAWLTQFFLPHISDTTSPFLNLLRRLAGPLLLLGSVLFLGAAVPLYWAKFRRRGAVTTGLYAFIGHPQYLGLAILGLGTLLLWPRFLVLIGYLTMLFLYVVLAHWEESQCLAQYGESYRRHQERTGRFLARVLSARLPTILPASGGKRLVAALGVYVLFLGASVAAGFGLRDYALKAITAWYSEDSAVISPALLSAAELRSAYRTATEDPRVQRELEPLEHAKRIVYVVPEVWSLADLPLDARPEAGGHHTPRNFDRRRYKLLFTRARAHQDASGAAILKTTYGLDPILRVRVDIAAAEVKRSKALHATSSGETSPPPCSEAGTTLNLTREV
ncbi:MAG: methyltransferase family protein [Gammaproteobacteria bacterium]